MDDLEFDRRMDRIERMLDKMAEAAQVFAESSSEVIRNIIATQQGAAKTIAASIKRSQQAREMLDEVKEIRDEQTRGSLQRTQDGQVVELPRGRK